MPPEPYRGQPVVDGTGRMVPVNGGPGFLLPAYLPPGYRLTPGTKGGLTLAGPHGAIELTEGGPGIGTVRTEPGFADDVRGRPAIGGAEGVLIRYRQDSGNTVLRWQVGDRGLSLQVFSTTLDGTSSSASPAASAEQETVGPSLKEIGIDVRSARSLTYNLSSLRVGSQT